MPSIFSFSLRRPAARCRARRVPTRRAPSHSAPRPPSRPTLWRRGRSLSAEASAADEPRRGRSLPVGDAAGARVVVAAGAGIAVRRALLAVFVTHARAASVALTLLLE